MLYPPKEIANFKNTRVKSSRQTLMLVEYPLPDKGYRYPVGRGSGLFISCLGVWRCLLRDKQEHHSTLSYINNKSQIGNGGDTRKQA